jgi:hypothetical protein
MVGALILLEPGHQAQAIYSAVLPGLVGASQPNRPKITAIWCKHTANSNFNLIPLLFSYFLTLIPCKK